MISRYLQVLKLLNGSHVDVVFVEYNITRILIQLASFCLTEAPRSLEEKDRACVCVCVCVSLCVFFVDVYIVSARQADNATPALERTTLWNWTHAAPHLSAAPAFVTRRRHTQALPFVRAFSSSKGAKLQLQLAFYFIHDHPKELADISQSKLLSNGGGCCCCCRLLLCGAEWRLQCHHCGLKTTTITSI